MGVFIDKVIYLGFLNNRGDMVTFFAQTDVDWVYEMFNRKIKPVFKPKLRKILDRSVYHLYLVHIRSLFL